MGDQKHQHTDFGLVFHHAAFLTAAAAAFWLLIRLRYAFHTSPAAFTYITRPDAGTNMKSVCKGWQGLRQVDTSGCHVAI